MVSLGGERPPSKTTNAWTKVFNREIWYRKLQRRSSQTTIGQTLRGVTMKEVLKGRNKEPKLGNDANLEKQCSPVWFMFFTLRGVTMNKVLRGQNKKPKFGNDANSEINVLSYVFFFFNLCICQDPRIAWAYTAQNTKFCALLACLAQPTYPIPARCGTDMAGRGAFEPPPEDVLHRSSPADVKQNKRSRVCHRKIQNISKYRLEMMHFL